jgi:hypothetical protein
MDIDGFDPRHDGKDSRTLDLKADDPRAFGLASEGDDDADPEGVEVESASLFDRLDPQASQQVTSIADLAVLMEEQFAILAADMDRKHRSFSRAMASELDTLRKDMNRPPAAEGWDNGIREHMRVVQGQTARVHHENIAKIEALKEIGATEFHGASDALSHAARDISIMTRRAIGVCIGCMVGLFLLAALLILW